MVALCIFGVLLLADFVTLLAVKVGVSKQATRRWSVTVANNNALNSDVGTTEDPGLNACRYKH
jgi:hypothetical protein